MRLFKKRRPQPGPSDPDGSKPTDLFALLNMAWAGQAVYTATQLGIPALLKDGPKTAEQLAQATGVQEGYLQQVLRTLAGFDILSMDESNRFHLTPISNELVSDSSWMHQYILLWGEQLYPAGGKMLDMVKSGTVACETAHGAPLYEYYRKDPAANERFINFMNATTEWQRNALIEAFDFSGYRHLIDVGGGRAGLLTGILHKYPDLRGTIIDQPHMEESVSIRIKHEGLSGRCTFSGGNFLQSVVPGGDVYLIKHVLHDWNDEDTVTILRNIREAMSKESVLIVIEAVLDDSNGVDQVVKLRDLEQMVWTGGKVRSATEFQLLFEQAGLKLSEIRKTPIVDAHLYICQA